MHDKIVEVTKTTITIATVQLKGLTHGLTAQFKTTLLSFCVEFPYGFSTCVFA